MQSISAYKFTCVFISKIYPKNKAPCYFVSQIVSHGFSIGFSEAEKIRGRDAASSGFAPAFFSDQSLDFVAA